MELISREPALALAPSAEGYFAYNIQTRQLHRLNPAAALIVELADGSRTAQQICSEIAPLLGPDTAGACLQWIENAKHDGIVTVAPADSAAESQSTANLGKVIDDLRSDGLILAAFVCQYHRTLSEGDSPQQWANLGELAHAIGRRSDARQAFEEYLNLVGNDAEVEHVLVSLRDEAAPPRAPDVCVRQLYARFAGFYEDNMRGELEYAGPELLAEALAELPGLHDLEIIDLGCGTGLGGKHLRPLARRLTGVDLSPEMAEKAAATNSYDAIEVAEITEWLGRSQTADLELIASFDTFIYFGDLRQILLPATRRLKPGACIIFTVERESIEPFRLTDSGRYAHSLAHINEVANEAGLIVVRMKDATLRFEYGEPVIALVATLKRR